MNHATLPDRPAANRLLDELFAQPTAVPPPPAADGLVLYGAGKLGRLALGLLQQLGIRVPFIVDRNAASVGELLGVPVIAPDAVPAEERRRTIGICVVTAPYEPLHASLQAAGWRDIHPVYDLLQPHAERTTMENGWFLPRPGPADMAILRTVMDAWNDDISRAAHLQFLAWRYARRECSFSAAPVHTDDRYFIPEVLATLGPEESFLDAGAYDGSVSEAFMAIVHGRFQQLTLIEGDPDNLAIARQRLAATPSSERLTFHGCALDQHAASRRFVAGQDLGSRLHGSRGTPVETRRIDDLALPVTFAKFHLEGQELPVLRGALHTLQTQRPLLAITVYHNADGAWRTAAFLRETLPGYRLLLRLHGWCGTAAVIYGIPEERLSCDHR